MRIICTSLRADVCIGRGCQAACSSDCQTCCILQCIILPVLSSHGKLCRQSYSTCFLQLRYFVSWHRMGGDLTCQCLPLFALSSAERRTIPTILPSVRLTDAECWGLQEKVLSVQEVALPQGLLRMLPGRPAVRRVLMPQLPQSSRQ